MESTGYFVTFQDSPANLQRQEPSRSILCCPVCDSKAAIIRAKRPRFRKWFTQKKLYFCRQCKTQFWAN